MPCPGWGWWGYLQCTHILTTGIPFSARQKTIAKLQIIEMGRLNYIECYCHSDIF